VLLGRTVLTRVTLVWRWATGDGKGTGNEKLISSCAFALGLAMGVSACTDPYDPGQRAVGGGAGNGAAIGGVAGGGCRAATGALIGGSLGALGGAATTPSPDYYGYGSSASGYNGYGSYGPQHYGSCYDGADYYEYGR
jgi:hypothetical protein